MELGISNLKSAIDWKIDYQTMESQNLTDLEISNLIKEKYFPELHYLYDRMLIKDLYNEKYFEQSKIIKKLNSKLHKIKEIPNEIIVETRIDKKKASNFPKLEKILKKDNLRLENVIDIEFFEFYLSHKKYLNNLNDNQDKILLKYTNLDHLNIINNFLKLEDSFFEDSFFSEDSSKIIDILNNNYTGINKKKYSTFMDTEKIHIQIAICSNNLQKNVPILAYFGFGNYYPFTELNKNKSLRFKRFSQLNHSDEIDINYFQKEFQKSKTQKEYELKKIIDESQINYFNYFQENFNLKNRKENFEKKYGKTEFSTFIDKILMLQPIFRTKSAALIAYNYNFY